MAGSDITAKVGIDGASEFKSEIKGINSSLKTMGAEMDKVTSEFIGNEDSAEALSAKNAVLAKQFDELSKKADLQRERLRTLESQGKQNSDEYVKLQGDLYKTEAAMNKTKAQIDKNTTSMYDLGDETEETSKDMDKGGKSAKSFGDILKANLVSEAIIGGVKALASGIKQLGGALLDAAAAADDLNTLSTVTGISTEQLQKFQYASDAIDVSVDTLAGSYSKLTKQMDAAASGSKTASAAFEQLGVSVTNDDGTFRDRNEVFNETIAALGQITDETERDATAMAIFGKSAQELNPLILGGADALAEMSEHAEEAGLILSQDALDALGGLSDEFGRMKTTAKIAGQQFLANFAGPVTESIETVTRYLERLLDAFQTGGLEGLATEVGEIASQVAATMTSVLPEIANFASNVIITLVDGLITMLPSLIDSVVQIATTLLDTLTEQLPQLLTVATEAVMTIVDKLTDGETISNLVGAAVTVVTTLATGIVKALPKLAAKIPEIVRTVVSVITDNLPELINAALEIVQTLAQSLGDLLPELAPVAVDAVLMLVDTLTAPENIGNLIDASIEIIVALANGLVGAIPNLLEKVPEIIMALVDAVIDNAPKVLEGAVELITRLAIGLVENVGKIADTASDIIGALVDGVKSLFSDVWNIGKDIVMGIWQGIKDQWEWFKGQISGFFSGIVSGVKETLGIASPSKVFAGIGTNMALGLGEGFDDTMGRVERDMMSSIPIPSVNVGAGAVPVSAGGSGALGMVEEIVIPVEVGGAELARVLYRHIVGEGQRIGAAAVV